jgi:CheY-like chemotaxis protein
MSEPEASSHPRVLAVEDDRETLHFLGVLLSAWGYEPTLATDGEAALAAVQLGMPDAVLLDLGLPGIDGFEVARELRGLPGGAALVIVVVTGARGHDMQLRAREAGCDLYLTKPVDPAALRQTLAQALPPPGRPRS